MSGMDRLKARQAGQISSGNPNLVELISNPALLTGGRDADVQQIPLELLQDYHAHTFAVREDETFQALVASIQESGIRTPLLVRPTQEPGCYEILSGHRRRRAAASAGLRTVPCLVVQADDDEATILMAESNIQRPDWLPSEKARTFAAWLKAIQHKTGIKERQRTDLTAGTGFPQSGRNRDLAAEKWGISGKAFSIYLRLGELIPQLLDAVDAKGIPVKAGYHLSFLSCQEQTMLHDYLQQRGRKVRCSLQQASDLHAASQELGVLSWDRMEEIMEPQRAKETEREEIPLQVPIGLRKAAQAALADDQVRRQLEDLIRDYAIRHGLLE